MKRLIPIFVILVGVLTHPQFGSADEVTPLESARRLRNVGIIFTSIGLALATVTTAAGIGTRSCAHASGEECGIVAWSTAVGTGVSALTFVLPGIPMWIEGDRRVRKAKKSLHLAASPIVRSGEVAGAQATATLRF